MMSKTGNMKNRILPSSRQLEYQNCEFGMFLAFGIRTFYDYTNDFGNANRSLFPCVPRPYARIRD